MEVSERLVSLASEMRFRASYLPESQRKAYYVKGAEEVERLAQYLEKQEAAIYSGNREAQNLGTLAGREPGLDKDYQLG